MADVVHVRDVKHYKPRLPTLVRDFKDSYLFEERNVQWLASRFLGTNEETRGVLSYVYKIKFFCVISVILAVKKGIGAELGVSQATVSRSVNAVFDSIIAHANECIKFPTTVSEIT
ncbi:hypothetical protein AVEN_120106-1 [Araneus ventricosus]|uniref:Uncharacterized protein n=1 Tax=Araneus ventricosus TaxID=182803 RepID=A0A4Y2G4X0_ARAVE|nr:hypothetical protein AVEN_120106-1 [Araneus ventricosus]